MASSGDPRFDQIWRYVVTLGIGPAAMAVGIYMKASHSVSCGDATMSPGEICRDANSGKVTTYDEAASGSQGVATFLIIAGVIITLAAAAWFLYRWQNRATRPLLPPKEPRRGRVHWTWVEARLSENAQNGLAVKISPNRFRNFTAARKGLVQHLGTKGQSDPVYRRGAAELASTNKTFPTIVAPPLAWFLVALPAKGDVKERMREVLAERVPELREALGAANTADAGSAENG